MGRSQTCSFFWTTITFTGPEGFFPEELAGLPLKKIKGFVENYSKRQQLIDTKGEVQDIKN